MKFLLLTNNDTDGVGQQAISLSSHLEKKGHKSKIVVLHKTKENSNLIKINRSFDSRSLMYLLNYLKKDFFGLFSFGHSTVNYDDLKYYVNESDVVIIYSLYKKTLHNRRVFLWAFRDLNPGQTDYESAALTN